LLDYGFDLYKNLIKFIFENAIGQIAFQISGKVT